MVVTCFSLIVYRNKYSNTRLVSSLIFLSSLRTIFNESIETRANTFLTYAFEGLVYDLKLPLDSRFFKWNKWNISSDALQNLIIASTVTSFSSFISTNHSRREKWFVVELSDLTHGPTNDSQVSSFWKNSQNFCWKLSIRNKMKTK